MTLLTGATGAAGRAAMAPLRAANAAFKAAARLPAELQAAGVPPRYLQPGSARHLSAGPARRGPAVPPHTRRSLRHTRVDVSEQAARGAIDKTGMPARPAHALLEVNALVRHGPAATLTCAVQQVLGRPPRSMRESATTAPGTA